MHSGVFVCGCFLPNMIESTSWLFWQMKSCYTLETGEHLKLLWEKHLNNWYSFGPETNADSVAFVCWFKRKSWQVTKRDDWAHLKRRQFAMSQLIAALRPWNYKVGFFLSYKLIHNPHDYSYPPTTAGVRGSPQGEKCSYHHHHHNNNHHHHQPPTTNHQPPTTNHQPPTTSHQPPVTNHQPPTTNHQPPTTNHQPPTTNHQPPTTNHQPPTTNHHHHHHDHHHHHHDHDHDHEQQQQQQNRTAKKTLNDIDLLQSAPNVEVHLAHPFWNTPYKMGLPGSFSKAKEPSCKWRRDWEGWEVAVWWRGTWEAVLMELWPAGWSAKSITTRLFVKVRGIGSSLSLNIAYKHISIKVHSPCSKGNQSQNRRGKVFSLSSASKSLL